MLAYWGKAKPGGEVGYHPAAYHSLDVAACAAALLDQMPLLRARLATFLDLDDPTRFVIAWVALHDIGKWSRPFQTMVPEHSALGPDRAEGVRHDAAGFWLWRDRVHTLFDDGLALMPIARAVFGHHGEPIAETSAPRLRTLYGAGAVAAEAYTRDVLALIPPGRVGPGADLIRVSWLIAGFTVLADWIGSSQAAFPYTRPEYSLADYWSRFALPRARDAVAATGVVPVPSAPVRNYPELTGIAGFKPTPLQRWAETVPLAQGLYILEDNTGAGKTEAAWMLAHRLIAAGLADGAYIALPTMATSDGLYERMSRMYRAAFEGRPSLVLAHGARDLHDQFRASVLDPAADSEFCSDWIADSKKATFLAQVGVGTIDQAILGILPSRHQCLRVLGLAKAVLILDEVHAYDAYVGREIEHLLEMQAALGGSTILMSATLPAEAKARFLKPYGSTAAAFSAAYPLATVQTETLIETPIAPRPETVRTVPLKFVTSPDAGLARALAAARDGQAVLYIRNSIADAIETVDALPPDISADLFHARFALCDRQQIQADALTRFGPRSTPDQRARLLIATQVVEQSLDLDFDLIVSDLAPVDLIIQRAGRLWRHTRQRPASAVREMVIVGPEPVANADADWLSDSLPRTANVYRDHSRLWLTADILRQHGAIAAPDCLRALVEHVYGPASSVPTALVDRLRQIDRKRAIDRGAATLSALTLSDGYFRGAAWDDEDDIETRLIEMPTVTLRLAIDRDGVILPWAQARTRETHPWRLWALSEVKAPLYYTRQDIVPAGLEAAAERAKTTWTDWQRKSVRLVVVSEDGSAGPLTYSPTLGLQRRAE